MRAQPSPETHMERLNKDVPHPNPLPHAGEGILASARYVRAGASRARPSGRKRFIAK
jgi:hypothetical protein